MFSYYGSKAKIAHWYPKPLYPIIVEPFAGAARYSLLYHLERNVILIEKNPRLVDIWHWLQQATEDEIRALPIPFKRGEFIPKRTPIPDISPKAAKDFLGLMLNQGSHTPKNFIGRFQGCACVSWNKVIERLPIIRNWDIRLGDYQDAPDLEATWFIDPPYSGQSLYKYGKDIDYGALAAWCRSRKGQVIVCEAAGATWLPFSPLRENTMSQRKHSKLRQEAIWTQEALCDHPAGIGVTSS